jgi:hypothetical protein
MIGLEVAAEQDPDLQTRKSRAHEETERLCTQEPYDSVVVQAYGESRMMARLRTGFVRTAVLALLFVVCAGPSLRAQGRPEFRVSRVASPPKIDGVLDDEAWKGDPLALGPWISYNPLRGETGPERTEVRSVYDDRERVFDVDIVNAKSVYQFDKHFLVRLLEQFDSSRRQLLSDLLASYEFVPGTVFHAGYGSLYERRGFENGQLVPNTGNYLTVSRGLFFKASYLYRF